MTQASKLPPAGGTEDFSSDCSDLDFATAVAGVRLRTPAELGMGSWASSVQQSCHGSAGKAARFVDLHRSDPQACHRLAEAVTILPEVGTELLGFRLLADLGEGAFGRVYLAQQGDLANRAVVLKVSPNIDDETRTLAQLQHTNIVPIYSVHRAGPLQAVCMPYFGATTLHHVLRELDGRQALPESGQEFVSTIVGRRDTIREADAGSVCSGMTAPPGLEPVVSESRCVGVGPPPNLELLQKLSYVEAVLWIGSCLADGLAHAHERGIVHRDLKPANVLLTDDGQPMLLDFNLAKDTKLGTHPASAQAGGTLPFMAPEQIEAFRSEALVLDYRSDVYSLGVILYRLLTGRPPFPSRAGSIKEVLEQMIQDRLLPPPSVRRWNPAVSPAAESIIRHCLEPDPDRRYASARQLKEDLDRQLNHLPLCHAPEPSLRERTAKWRRRHPWLASTTSVVILAGLVIAMLLGVVAIRGRRLAELDARESLNSFLEGRKAAQYLLTVRTDEPAQVDQGVQLGQRVLDTYGAPDQSVWPDPAKVRHLSEADQARLRRYGAELLVMLARGTTLRALNQGDAAARQELLAEALRLNELAESCSLAEQESRALWRQRAELMGLLGRGAEADRLKARAEATPLRSRSDRYLVAAEHAAKGRFREALPLLAEITAEDPQDYWAWFLRGACQDHLAQPTEALASYSTCIALAPQSPWAYLNRGLTYLGQGSYTQAAADLDRVIDMRPNHGEAYKSRAIAWQGLGKLPEAEADLARALELGAAPTHVHFLRAAVRDRAGDKDGARRDRADGLRRQPTDELGWLTRGYARMSAEPKAALEDFEQALKLNARSLPALQNKAHLLSKLGKNEEAARTLDRAVDAHPEFILARAGRAVLLARLGKREDAHKDVADCLANDQQPLTLYQLAGVYALTSKTHADDRKEAFRLLSAALQKGVGFEFLEMDRDLDPIRTCPEFQRLVDAARAIRGVGATAANGKS
jgi:serine/threonine protein kinase/tetratricopeptide (TPR) repeat protein